MFFRSFLRYGTSGQETNVRRRARQHLTQPCRRTRLSIEVLENRTLLSTFMVDHLADDVVGSGLNGSLRYCITHAVDNDTIDFGVTGTINLTGQLPNLYHSVSIEGPEADLMTVRRDTGGNYRLFTVSSGTTVISGLTIANGDVGDGYGGGISNYGTLTVSNSILFGNTADVAHALDNSYGGGIYNAGTLTVSNSTLSVNTLNGLNIYGGGIYNAGTLTVSNSTLAGNIADSGGGISNGGTLTVSNSTLSGTTGGGISNGGTLTVSNSTLCGNAGGYGGGISNFGTLTVSNSTLSGNSSHGNDGGGIYTSTINPVTLTNVTLTANRTERSGGGLYVSSGSPVLHNTLIAGNFRGLTGTSRDDVYGALNSGGDYNLIGDGTGMSGLTNGVNGNLVGSAAAPIDPLLGPLQDNGGPTNTHALLAGSPALNAGDPAQLGVADQRGVVRAGGVNIGAYEASASAFVLTVPGTVAAGTPFDVTVQAVDIFGQVAFGYTGTVTFRVTDPDPAVVVQPDYTFTADDQGTHTFTGGFTLITPGPWTLTVADLANGLTQDMMLTVNP
jgi:hypothetical protein